MRRFAGPEPDRDATAILDFRRLLERHDLSRAIFEAVDEYLRERGILLREGTLVDAPLIDAPSPPKNERGACDPATPKGDDWCFGRTAHVGADLDSGVVHALEARAKAPDSQKFDNSLHGDERSAVAIGSGNDGDGHVSSGREDACRAGARSGASGAENEPLERFLDAGTAQGADGWRAAPVAGRNDRIIARLRARGEPPSRVVKCRFGYRKTRYRGLATKEARLSASSTSPPPLARAKTVAGTRRRPSFTIHITRPRPERRSLVALAALTAERRRRNQQERTQISHSLFRAFFQGEGSEKFARVWVSTLSVGAAAFLSRALSLAKAISIGVNRHAIDPRIDAEQRALILL